MKIKYIVIICLISLTGIIFLHDARSHYRFETMKSIPTEQVRVTQGDTLWEIAQKYPVDSLSLEQTVYWIVKNNDLTDSRLIPGQQLSVAKSQNTLVY